MSRGPKRAPVASVDRILSTVGAVCDRASNCLGAQRASLQFGLMPFLINPNSLMQSHSPEVTRSTTRSSGDPHTPGNGGVSKVSEAATGGQLARLQYRRSQHSPPNTQIVSHTDVKSIRLCR